MQKGGVISFPLDSNQAFDVFLRNVGSFEVLSTGSISGYVFKLTIDNIENSPYYKFRGLETLDSDRQIAEKVGTILVKAMLTHTGRGVERVLRGTKEVADENTFNEEVNAQQELAFSTPGLFEPITPTVLFSKFDCKVDSVGNKIIGQLTKYIDNNPRSDHLSKLEQFIRQIRLGYQFGIVVQEIIASRGVKFTLNLGTLERDRRERGSEIDVSLALYSLFTAASYGYMHQDYHRNNMIIDTQVKENSVFYCNNELPSGFELSGYRSSDYERFKQRMGFAAITPGRKEIFARCRVYTIDWGRYKTGGNIDNRRNFNQSNFKLLYDKFKTSNADNELVNNLLNLIKRFRFDRRDSNEWFAYTWLTQMNSITKFKKYNSTSETVNLLQIARNVLFLIYGRRKKELILAQKVINLFFLGATRKPFSMIFIFVLNGVKNP